MTILVEDNPASALAEALSKRVIELQAAGRTPKIVLTGGTIATEAYRLLSDRPGLDWGQVIFWWGDERFVPVDHPDRNDEQADQAFLSRLGVPRDHQHRMPAPGSGQGQDLQAAADAYVTTLPASGFDVVLLGVGPDGHVASLFPGFAQLNETERLVVGVPDSPKPPPQRITLTAQALSHTDAVWYVAAGLAKSEAIARALEPHADDAAAADAQRRSTPARAVTARLESRWYLDADAACLL